MLSCSDMSACGLSLDFLTKYLYSVLVWIFIMAFVIYSAHIIHYHMDPSQLVVLGQSYFMHPQLSGCTLLDLGHLAASNHYHSGRGTRCLEVCPDI